MFRTLSITVFLIMLSTGSAAAQWQQDIRNAIYHATWEWRQDGYSAGTVHIGTLDDGDYIYLYYTLAAGVSYRFVGKCDGACGDLDLALYDENGNLISSDTDYDNTPVVTVRPQWTGQFRVKVSMADCSNDYCGYGLGVYIR